jgi:hypothetical protein
MTGKCPENDRKLTIYDKHFLGNARLGQILLGSGMWPGIIIVSGKMTKEMSGGITIYWEFPPQKKIFHLLQRTPSVDEKFGSPVPSQRNPVLHYAHEFPMISMDILDIVGSQEEICRNMKDFEEI